MRSAASGIGLVFSTAGRSATQAPTNSSASVERVDLDFEPRQLLQTAGILLQDRL